jgi:hypothetical protein
MAWIRCPAPPTKWITNIPSGRGFSMGISWLGGRGLQTTRSIAQIPYSRQNLPRNQCRTPIFILKLALLWTYLMVTRFRRGTDLWQLRWVESPHRHTPWLQRTIYCRSFECGSSLIILLQKMEPALPNILSGDCAFEWDIWWINIVPPCFPFVCVFLTPFLL